MMMEIKTIVVGPIETNCYLLTKNNNCVIIDPGDEANKIKHFIGNNKLIGIIITHHHYDHVDALTDFNDIPIYDYHNLNEGSNNMDNFKFDIIHTLGHSDDSITIYFKDDKVMFTGDFLFNQTIGRTDLPGGSREMMLNSIEMIKEYDNEIIIYPGHGESTILGHEKRYNPYF